MSLTKSVLNVGRLALRLNSQIIVPFNEFRTSAALPATWRHWMTYFKDPKPEYDEKGELGWPDDYYFATGMLKKELDARAAGNDDPYDLGEKHRGDKGTKVDPIMVPSAFESRMISCHCEPEMCSTMPIWLHQGEPKRCKCGYWFLLYYREPFVDYKLIVQ